jgi:hypothetical protein
MAVYCYKQKRREFTPTQRKLAEAVLIRDHRFNDESDGNRVDLVYRASPGKNIIIGSHTFSFSRNLRGDSVIKRIGKKLELANFIDESINPELAYSISGIYEEVDRINPR